MRSWRLVHIKSVPVWLFSLKVCTGQADSGVGMLKGLRSPSFHNQSIKVTEVIQVKREPSSNKEVSPPNDDCWAAFSHVSLDQKSFQIQRFHEQVVTDLCCRTVNSLNT